MAARRTEQLGVVVEVHKQAVHGSSQSLPDCRAEIGEAASCHIGLLGRDAGGALIQIQKCLLHLIQLHSIHYPHSVLHTPKQNLSMTCYFQS